MGTLFLVATPIGNLDDMTFRAIDTLRSVSLIAAEDTRHSGRLLKHFEIETPMVSFHGHSSRSKVEKIMNELEHGDVAVITDAGMPGISDPGAELVREAVERSLPVVPIPGASAVTAAAAVSGLVEAGFLFGGYPPRKKQERRTFLTGVAATGYPVVLFESPHRIVSTLEDLAEVVPDAKTALCRELTKLYEEVLRGDVHDVLSRMRASPPRGEVALVFVGGDSVVPGGDRADTEHLAQQLLNQGMPPSRAARELARLTGEPRSQVYALILELSNKRDQDASSES